MLTIYLNAKDRRLIITGKINVEVVKKLIFIRGPLNAFTNNDCCNERYKMDSRNLKILNELKKLGTKFILCGQALSFFSINKEEILRCILKD